MERVELLDCNRLFSSEVKGNNNKSKAIFTNKLGSGIQVNPGDRVSVHNAFISEVGADENAIQFSDKFLEKRTIEYTKLTGEVPINACNEKVMGFERITASNVTESVDNNVNQTNILLNYYKTANGENYFQLPRRYAYMNINTMTRANSWDNYDIDTMGRAYFDTVFTTTINIPYPQLTIEKYFVDEDYFFFQAPDQDNASIQNRYKLKNDNSRYQIFVQTDARYGAQSQGGLPVIINASDYNGPANLDYIEYTEKLNIKLDKGFISSTGIAQTITDQLRKIEQPEKRFITDNASSGGNVEKHYYQSGSGVLLIDQSINQPSSVEINTATYHTFYAASQATNNLTTWGAWNGLGTVNNTYKWLSSFQYIGVKRPDLFVAGREFAKYMLSINTDGATTLDSGMKGFNASIKQEDFIINNGIAPGNASYVLITNMEWNTTTLDYLRDLFIAQGNYPELFTNHSNQYSGYTSENTSRFLHLNLRRDDNRGALSNRNKYQLGFDYISNINGSMLNLNSTPLFFDYYPEFANASTGGNSVEEGYHYGFALKKLGVNGRPYIAMTMAEQLFGGNASANFSMIPDAYFKWNDYPGSALNGSMLNNNTRFGWDITFGAYGNAHIGLMDGWTDVQYHDQSLSNQNPTAYFTPGTVGTTQPNLNPQIVTSAYSQKIYLGAQEPLLNYNNISNKFEISQLHTAERVQNPYNAGGIDDQGNIVVNEFSTSGRKVYKINKRLYNTNYTPAVLPYGANSASLTLAGENPGNYKVDFLNPNLDPWTIFDQLCGIIIKDFGYSKDQWDNGIWGILGFSYNQFNSSKTSANDLTTRIGTDNKNNLPYAITNAKITAKDTMDFVSNIFGAQTYSLQLPIVQSFFFENEYNTALPTYNPFFRRGYRYEQYPAIVENASSIVLSAQNIPKKLSNPYFCIRSNILDESSYTGGFDSGELYPVIAVIPKSNDYRDFYVNLDTGVEFVFNKSKVITEITTSIHDPSQELAEVGDNSAVIYKIIKQIPETNFNIVEQIMNENKKK